MTFEGVTPLNPNFVVPVPLKIFELPPPLACIFCEVENHSRVCQIKLSFCRCSGDLDLIAEIKKLSSLINVAPKRLSSWEVVINKEDMRVWKRPVEDTCLYEFKGRIVSNLNREGQAFLKLVSTVFIFEFTLAALKLSLILI